MQLGQMLAILFFSFSSNPFLFLFDLFQILFNVQLQKLAKSAPLIQNGHMAYGFWVESFKLQHGAIHLLVWGSILLIVAFCI